MYCWLSKNGLYIYIMHLWSFHPLFIVFLSSFHILFILFSSSFHPLFVLFSSSFRPLFVLFSSSFLHFLSSFHPLFILFSSTVFLLIDQPIISSSISLTFSYHPLFFLTSPHSQPILSLHLYQPFHPSLAKLIRFSSFFLIHKLKESYPYIPLLLTVYLSLFIHFYLSQHTVSIYYVNFFIPYLCFSYISHSHLSFIFHYLLLTLYSFVLSHRRIIFSYLHYHSHSCSITSSYDHHLLSILFLSHHSILMWLLTIIWPLSLRIPTKIFKIFLSSLSPPTNKIPVVTPWRIVHWVPPEDLPATSNAFYDILSPFLKRLYIHYKMLN